MKTSLIEEQLTLQAMTLLRQCLFKFFRFVLGFPKLVGAPANQAIMT